MQDSCQFRAHPLSSSVMHAQGLVFDIQRFSLHDGPGIRTTVFLKGCPLRCLWCHNPEGLTAQPQVRLIRRLCTRCGRCMLACPHGGHAVTADEHRLRPAACTRCGQCAAACDMGALEMVGQWMSVEEVLCVVRRDAPFYQQSGGGMTLSGGEPLAQYAFARALLAAAKTEGLHTAMETTALLPWPRLVALAPLLDRWLVDLKHTDAQRHRALTGAPNRRILANIRRMADAGWPLALRIPWVPLRNAEPAFLDGLCAFLRSLSTPPPVEFMPYHRLGQEKWAALGGDAAMPESIPAADRADIEPWAEALRREGITVTIG